MGAPVRLYKIIEEWWFSKILKDSCDYIFFNLIFSLGLLQASSMKLLMFILKFSKAMINLDEI